LNLNIQQDYKHKLQHIELPLCLTYHDQLHVWQALQANAAHILPFVSFKNLINTLVLRLPGRGRAFRNSFFYTGQHSQKKSIDIAFPDWNPSNEPMVLSGRRLYTPWTE
jgi:macrodomain Ter protein organizer (MatP/YcbG family)